MSFVSTSPEIRDLTLRLSRNESRTRSFFPNHRNSLILSEYTIIFEEIRHHIFHPLSRWLMPITLERLERLLETSRSTSCHLDMKSSCTSSSTRRTLPLAAVKSSLDTESFSRCPSSWSVTRIPSHKYRSWFRRLPQFPPSNTLRCPPALAESMSARRTSFFCSLVLLCVFPYWFLVLNRLQFGDAFGERWSISLNDFLFRCIRIWAS